MKTSTKNFDIPFFEDRPVPAKAVKNVHLPFLKMGLTLFCLVILILAWGLTLRQLRDNRISILSGLAREHSNLATIIAENLYQVLEQERAIALFAQDYLDNHRKDSLHDIRGFIYGGQAFNRIALFDLSGRQFYQSSPRNYRVDEAIIKQHLAEVIESDLPMTISPMFATSELSWQVPLLFPLKVSRKIRAVMLLELDLGYILNLYEDIDFGKSGSIAIQTDSGLQLARFESGGLVAGINSTENPVTLHERKLGNPGTFDSPLVANGRHIVFHRVEHYPFIISVSQSLSDIFADFHQRKKQQLFLLSLITFAGLAGYFYLIQAINRKQHYYLALAASHTENSRLLEKLESEHKKAVNAASFDSLTNLYNRRLFASLGQKNLLLAKRNRFSYAVLFIDLDRFKAINDTLGHRIGDLLLQEVAKRLTGCVRESDIVSRFGGDEFVIMLTEMTPETNIAQIAEKVIKSLSQPCENLDGHTITTSPSIGIAIFPRDGENMEALIRNADAAMYNSKRSGRGRYSFFDSSLNTVSVQHFELEQRIPVGLANNEFILHYQPKIRLEDFRVVGLEALIRWQHPVHQLIYPGDFVPCAESTGLIEKLGEWTLETACRQVTEWREAGIPLVPVAVNVSPLELKNPNYSSKFFEILKRHNLGPNEIEVEVTESAFIEDKDSIKENLDRLFQGGVAIALDDFGNGFSSLSHIRSLPAKVLKIDRSFIRDIRNSHSDNVIVSSTIILAQKLNLTVVAEGVESHDQLVHLKVAGCDQVQGYFFCRPAAEEKIREFLQSPIRIPTS